MHAVTTQLSIQIGIITINAKQLKQVVSAFKRD